MKKIVSTIIMSLFGFMMLSAAPVITLCNGNSSSDVKFSIEYNKPYWTVGKGRSTTNRIFRYDEGSRRIVPIRGRWVFELKTSTPNRLVDSKGKVILEYRNGSIYKPGISSPVAIYKNNCLYKGSKCVANFRNGKVPLGLVLAIAAQYYFPGELGFTPVKFTNPAPKSKEVKLHILSVPFNKQAVTRYSVNGKVVYTFRNGFIYEGEAEKDNTGAALYAVSLKKFASVGKKKRKTPYIIQFFNLKNKTFVPECTAQNIIRYALFSGDSVTGKVLLHMGKDGKIYAGSQNKDAIACINKDGSRVYKGAEPAGTPVLTVEGNRYNYWVDWFIWNKVLEKEIKDYLAVNKEASKPFPAAKK